MVARKAANTTAWTATARHEDCLSGGVRGGDRVHGVLTLVTKEEICVEGMCQGDSAVRLWLSWCGEGNRKTGSNEGTENRCSQCIQRGWSPLLEGKPI